jgi:hypothetical protein
MVKKNKFQVFNKVEFFILYKNKFSQTLISQNKAFKFKFEMVLKKNS